MLINSVAQHDQLKATQKEGMVVSARGRREAEVRLNVLLNTEVGGIPRACCRRGHTGA